MKTYNELRQMAVDGIIADRASDLGVYPKSVEGFGPASYTERTDYMNGWNECQHEQLERHTALLDFMKSLTIEQRKAAEDLLLDNDLYFSKSDDTFKMYVNMNDIFIWGCADGEYIEPADLPLAAELNELFGYDGLIAWAAKHSGNEPTNYLNCVPDNRYKEARDYLNAKLKGQP